jgi:hypothetical protein
MDGPGVTKYKATVSNISKGPYLFLSSEYRVAEPCYFVISTFVRFFYFYRMSTKEKILEAARELLMEFSRKTGSVPIELSTGLETERLDPDFPLLLVFVFCTSCKEQNKTELPKRHFPDTKMCHL